MYFLPKEEIESIPGPELPVVLPAHSCGPAPSSLSLQHCTALAARSLMCKWDDHVQILPSDSHLTATSNNLGSAIKPVAFRRLQ